MRGRLSGEYQYPWIYQANRAWRFPRKYAKTLKQTSALPAVCGRVCPQEKQCESRCIHLKMNSKPVAIGYLERFAADYERESGQIALPDIAPSNGKKIAVVGSGPSGLRLLPAI